jgi:hypothetical protein
MTPTARAQLGLVPLPEDQARRVEQQGRELAAGRYARWPTGLQHLTPLIPAGEAVELVDEDGPDSGWAQWDLATKLGDKE